MPSVKYLIAVSRYIFFVFQNRKFRPFFYERLAIDLVKNRGEKNADKVCGNFLWSIFASVFHVFIFEGEKKTVVEKKNKKNDDKKL